MKLIRYEGENVTPSDDAILYRKFLSDGLFATVTPTFTSGAITIPAMRGVMCGRDFTTDIETLTAVLASSGTITGQIYMWIDMEDETYPLSIKIRNSVGSLSDDDINNGGQYYGLEIAQYTANTSAVTGVTLTVGLVQQELDVHKAESANKHITESGNNENGYYLKFDDGTMVCYKTSLTTLTTTGGTSPLFKSSPEAWTYPASFINIPTVTVSPVRSAGSVWVGNAAGIYTAYANGFFLYGETNASAGTLSFMAIGRWKA